MKEYFLKKLKEIEDNTESTTRSILIEVHKLNLTTLRKLSRTLLELNNSKEMFTMDLCKNCSVSEVIEVNKIVKLDYNTVRYSYDYISEGITLNEKNHLITAFGCALNGSKLK
jgi:hypothetical protein